jgi:hypothetical protein
LFLVKFAFLFIKNTYRYVLLCILHACIALPAAAQKAIRYSLTGTAVHQGQSQGYRLDVVDDGTGKIAGENVSIVEKGRKIIGEVKGSINYAKHKIYFKEIRVTNLRPGETQNDYCFFEVNADYIIKDGRTIISGKFVGHSPNGQVCGTGNIYLIGPKNVEEIHTEYIKKITEKKVVSPIKKLFKPKKIIVPKVIIDTPKIIVKKDTLPTKEKNIFPSVGKGVSMYEYDHDTLQFNISDYDKEDGDRVSVFINEKVLMADYVLTNAINKIPINMLEYGNGTGIDTIIVYAHNDGYYTPNSAKVLIDDGVQQYLFYACNNYREKKYLILRKRK